jgi:CubicO group peptidase (beta-lactamase class C family)
MIDIQDSSTWKTSLALALFMMTGVVEAAEQRTSDPPVTGRPVPAMSHFDDRMVAHMEAHGIEAGILGIMRHGEIVYLRGFGHLRGDIPMRENALVRLASVVKPMTAAAVRHMIAAQPGLSLDSNAFDLGQAGGGVIDPFEDADPGLGWEAGNDWRLRQVSVEQLLRHTGGWDRHYVQDLTTRECDQAEALDMDSPPGRYNQLARAMGKPLQFPPGDPTSPHDHAYRGEWEANTSYNAGDVVSHDCDCIADFRRIAWIATANTSTEPTATNPAWTQATQPFPVVDEYANIGYLAMGIMVERRSGTSFLNYLRNNIVTRFDWIPWTEIRQARTYRFNDLSAPSNRRGQRREPRYYGHSAQRNVFNNCSSWLTANDSPYGYRDLEARLSHGGVIASAPVLLTLAEHYHIGSGTTWSSIGTPREEQTLWGEQRHGGAQQGVSTLLAQRSDGTNIFIFFNRRVTDATATNLYLNSGDASDQADQGIQGLVMGMNNSGNWPTATSDGFWVQVESASGGGLDDSGAFDAPLNGFGDAVMFLGHGSKVRMKPGTYDWTGTINRRLLIDAPLGTVRIGE